MHDFNLQLEKLYKDHDIASLSANIKWCNFLGQPSSPATQKPLSVIFDVKRGVVKASARDLIFRNPETFIAGELHNHLNTWNLILKDFHKREEVFKYISQGVSVFDFFKPFKGMFQGKSYESEQPPRTTLPNSKTCDKFEDFICQTILDRVRNGSLSIWGREGHCEPPHLVLPITIEPSKPRMCHDERFLNLWINCPPVRLDPITDLPRYVGSGHYQTKLDDKSGYDHIKLTNDSKKFFGLYWKGWFFTYNTLPFGWSASAYVYQTVGLGASSFIRSNGVPLSQYIDDRHVGQLQLPSSIKNKWKNIELADASLFICALVLIHCGYFIGLTKSVLIPSQKLIFLGLVSDSIEQAFSLPNEKKEKFKTFRESILAEKKVCVKTLQKFAGKVISFALAVPAAKLYTREINANISKGLRSSRPVELTKDLRVEIEHWRFIDSLQDPLRWSLEKHYSVSISSDASNSGWGGILSSGSSTTTTHDYWSDDEKALPIAIREALALYKTLATFSDNIVNSRVDAFIDNMNLLSFWNNEGGKNIPLSNEIKKLFCLCLKLNIQLRLQYTPSKLLAADAPSRFHSDLDCCLSEKAWQVVERAYGPHSFDLMATPSNVRKDRFGNDLPFFSAYPCKGTRGVNIFTQDIPSDANCYIFPPFVLMGALLKYLQPRTKQITIIVADVSPRKYWWPSLNSLSVDRTLLGSKGQDGVLFFPPTTKLGWHTRPLAWDLYAYKLIFSVNS